jgi:hypothetical protein
MLYIKSGQKGSIGRWDFSRMSSKVSNMFLTTNARPF